MSKASSSSSSFVCYIAARIKFWGLEEKKFRDDGRKRDMSKIVFSESITFSRRHNQSDGNHDATSSMSENKDRAGNDQTERENSFDFIADDPQKKNNKRRWYTPRCLSKFERIWDSWEYSLFLYILFDKLVHHSEKCDSKLIWSYV